MRISLTMTVTVTLLLVVITGLSAANTEYYQPQHLPMYNDTCKYNEQNKCGDKCIDRRGYCSCGNKTIASTWETLDYCYIPSDKTCDFTPASESERFNPFGRRQEVAVCSQGVKIPISSHCNNSASVMTQWRPLLTSSSHHHSASSVRIPLCSVHSP